MTHSSSPLPGGFLGTPAVTHSSPDLKTAVERLRKVAAENVGRTAADITCVLDALDARPYTAEDLEAAASLAVCADRSARELKVHTVKDHIVGASYPNIPKVQPAPSAPAEGTKMPTLEATRSMTPDERGIHRVATRPSAPASPIIAATDEHPAIYRDGHRLTANRRAPAQTLPEFTQEDVQRVLKVACYGVGPTDSDALYELAHRLQATLVAASDSHIDTERDPFRFWQEDVDLMRDDASNVRKFAGVDASKLERSEFDALWTLSYRLDNWASRIERFKPGYFAARRSPTGKMPNE